MSDSARYPVPSDFSEAHITPERYREWYQQSIDNPEQFWSDRAGEFLDWQAPWTEVAEYDLASGSARWFSRRQAQCLGQLHRSAPSRAR